jgi:hypothetical protein
MKFYKCKLRPGYHGHTQRKKELISAVIWTVTPRFLEEGPGFGGTYQNYLHGRKETSNPTKKR